MIKIAHQTDKGSVSTAKQIDTDSFSLPEHSVHIWISYDLEVFEPAVLARCTAVLSETERAKQKRLVFPYLRHQFLITRALVRRVLSSYRNDIAPHEWRFEANAYGRPAIAASQCHKDLYFNISHTDGAVVMAVARQPEVGIDIEALVKRKSSLELAKSYFAPSEYAALVALSHKQRKQRFFDYWTLKEAYIKACGLGLSIPLNSFRFTIPSCGEISVEFTSARRDSPERWAFFLFDIGRFKMALAAAYRGLTPSDILAYREVPFGERAGPFNLSSPLELRMLARPISATVAASSLRKLERSDQLMLKKNAANG